MTDSLLQHYYNLSHTLLKLHYDFSQGNQDWQAVAAANRIWVWDDLHLVLHSPLHELTLLLNPPPLVLSHSILSFQSGLLKDQTASSRSAGYTRTDAADEAAAGASLSTVLDHSFLCS